MNHHINSPQIINTAPPSPSASPKIIPISAPELDPPVDGTGGRLLEQTVVVVRLLEEQ